MAPINRTATKVTLNAKKHAASSENDITHNKALYSKRKAEHSPPKNGNVKRAALNTIHNLQLINNGKAAKVKSIIKNEKNCLTEKTNSGKTSIAPGPETRAKLSRFASGIRLQGPFAGNNVTKSRYSNVNSISPVPNNSHNLKSRSCTRSAAITNGVRSTLSKPTVSKSVCQEKKISAKTVPKETSCKLLTVHEDEELSVNTSKNESVLLKLRSRASKPTEECARSEVDEGNKIKFRPAVDEGNKVKFRQEVDEGNKIKFHKSPFPSRRSLRLLEKSDMSDEKLEKSPEQLSEKIEQISQTSEESKQNENDTKIRRSLRNITGSKSLSEEGKKFEISESHASEETKSCSICPAECVEEEDKIQIRRSLRNIANSKKLSEENEKGEEKKAIRRSSTRYSLTRKSLSVDKSTENGSLYVSAIDTTLMTSVEQSKNEKNIYSELSEFDRELIHDPHQVSLYAMEIFTYLKSREANFQISDYMGRQPYINKQMRATLVDWMVEVQENFELNHETLYLAVKLVDMYLEKVKIHRESLQLVGAAAIFLSCKYDERLSPLLDDFIYIGDGAYDRNGLLAMEQSILKQINFELSVPISYSFLRRYARCARIQMPLLTLARYILELGLMDYNTVTLSDSRKAAAALYLAFKMVKHSDWTDALVYYTGYKLSDFKDIVLLFNRVLHQKSIKEETTIRNKYSHELFFKVAETPLLRNEELHLDT